MAIDTLFMGPDGGDIFALSSLSVSMSICGVSRVSRLLDLIQNAREIEGGGKEGLREKASSREKDIVGWPCSRGLHKMPGHIRMLLGEPVGRLLQFKPSIRDELCDYAVQYLDGILKHGKSLLFLFLLCPQHP
jgi:hypothetical protein